MAGAAFASDRALRELSRTLSKLAQFQAPPNTRAKISGCTRKKFATMRSAVGHFVGSDVMRAPLDNDEYKTTHNIAQLHFVIVRAGWHADLIAVEAENEELGLELAMAQHNELLELLRINSAPSHAP